MKLYLVRHATASDVASSDAARELTREGRDEARIVGRALVELGAKPMRFLSSPLVRAHQTAKITAEAMDFSGVVESLEELANGAPTAALLKALRPYISEGEIVLFGHMPSLAEHLAALVGSGSSQGFPLGKASAACVELAELRSGAGQLRWLMRQKQLRQIAKS